jgi:hypothetical protein
VANRRDDYDHPWKDALAEFFQEFIEFFFPAVYDQIDWEKGFSFEEQELQKLWRESEVPGRSADKLVRVARTSGEAQSVFVHVEVQAYWEKDFARRMFTYHYRLFDRHEEPLASLAVFADQDPDWHPGQYEYEVFGCRLKLDYPSVKLLEYGDQLEELLKGDNAFALVTAGHILTQRTHGNPEDRLAAKFRLIRILYDRCWSRKRVIGLFRIMDWPMDLPDNLDQRFHQKLRNYEEKKNMPYVTSIERRARQEGREEGIEKGERREAARMLRRQLIRRFGPLPERIEQKLSSARTEQIEEWGEALMDADSLNAVFQPNGD